MKNPKHIIYIVAHIHGRHDEYVVHRQYIGHFDSSELELNYIRDKSLPSLRKILKAKNLNVVERTIGDDPLIVEKWI